MSAIGCTSNRVPFNTYQVAPGCASGLGVLRRWSLWVYRKLFHHSHGLATRCAGGHIAARPLCDDDLETSCRRPVHHMDVEARILRAAIEVLSSAGFAGVTISAVARVAGVSRPTVYAHYGDRESLVSAVLGSVTTEVASRVISEARSAPTAAEFV